MEIRVCDRDQGLQKPKILTTQASQKWLVPILFSMRGDDLSPPLTPSRVLAQESWTLKQRTQN